MDIKSIKLRGQALTQAPQPVHFSISIILIPDLSKEIASNLHAFKQSLNPTQPQEQEFGPPAILTAERQVSMPL